MIRPGSPVKVIPRLLHQLRRRARRSKTTKVAEKKIPLFPRRTVRPNCRHAMSGSVTTTDANSLANVKGMIAMTSDSLENGADHRNAFCTQNTFSTPPLIQPSKFTIDSVSGVSTVGDNDERSGDRDISVPRCEKANARAITSVTTPQGLRVRGMFAMPAADLEHTLAFRKLRWGAVLA
jgi:hypothetical protein